MPADTKFLEDFVIYILRGIKQTSIDTINLILDINAKLEESKILIQKGCQIYINMKLFYTYFYICIQKMNSSEKI